MKKHANFVYILDGKAYINLTNRCHNACVFCIRNTGDGVAGTPLWLEREPTAGEVMAAFDALKEKGAVKENEVVFCGYGEPTERMDVLKECAERLKAKGYSTRLNTNGLGSAVNGRDITGELNAIDTVSVSLNSSDEKKYLAVTRSSLGEKAFSFVIDFAKKCKARGMNTVFTVVDTIGKDDIEKCKALAEEAGISLRVREYVSDNYGGNT